MEPLISIIVVNFNGIKDTLELLFSIEKFLDLESVEVIVVDNGSLNTESIAIAKHYPWSITIRSEVNLGFAGGNNLGIQASRGKYVLLLNNDTLLKDNSLMKLPDAFIADSTIGVVSPKILFHNPTGYIQYAGYSAMSRITIRNSTIGLMQKDEGQFDTITETFYAHGAAMVVSREVLDNVGMMSESFFLYYEEMDWCEQIRSKGYRIIYDPSAIIIHKEGMSVGKESPLKKFYMVRNRLLFAKRNRTGVVRCLSVTYQLLIAVPKEFIRLLLKGNVKAALSTIKGVVWFILDK
jgi:hypothetical protein